MTTHKEALMLALGALEYVCRHYCSNIPEPVNSAITAIDKALAQPEQQNCKDGSCDCCWTQPEQEPVAWTDENVIAWCLARGVKAAEKITPPQRIWVGLTKEQKLECWLSVKSNGIEYKTEHQQQVDYGSEIETKLRELNEVPQRTWVGLTEQEMDACGAGNWSVPTYCIHSIVKNAEAKLKEKNT